MTRLLLALLSLAFLGLWLPAMAELSRTADSPVLVNRPIKDKWAVVVGISRFANPKLNLDCSENDARAVYDYLVKDAHFAPNHIKLLLNEDATRANILSALGRKWLSRLANPDDLVLIYFSTHGSELDPALGDVNYLVAHDTDRDELLNSGIAMQDISRTIRAGVHSDRVVLFLDACHSGTVSPAGKGLTRGGNIDVEAVAQGTGQLVISSSKPDQVSWEAKSGKNSVFTKHLLASLRQHGPSTKLGDAFEIMKDRVQEEVLRDRAVLQTPVMKSKWQGNDLVLAAPPTQRRPGLEEESPEIPKSVAAVPPVITPPPAAAVAAPPAPPPVAHLPVRFLLLNSAPPIKWKIDSAISNPELLGEKDLPVLASLLTKDVYEKLHAEFPSAVIPVGANRLGPQPPNQDYAATCAHIGSTYQTKYLIHIIIDSFTFDLNVLTGNTYKMSVSGYIIDASTGQKIFALKEHTIKETTWVKDQVMGWRAYAQQKLVPHVAKYIVENISAPIHTRIDQGQRSAP